MNSYFGSYYNKAFRDIFKTKSEFIQEFKDSDLYTSAISDQNLGRLYSLLYAEYAYGHPASFDTEQFKLQMFAIISTKGILWSRRLDIQNQLATMTLDDIKKVARRWQNIAQDPGRLSDGKIGEDVFLDYIQNQMVSNGEKTDYEALVEHLINLGTNIGQTQDFIRSFKKLFTTVVDYERPLYYESEEYEYEE